MIMKKFIPSVSILLLSCTLLFASDAEEIVNRMERAMHFEDAVISGRIVSTDRFGSFSTVFESLQRENGDSLLTVTEGADRGQKILRLGNDIYIYYPDAAEVIRLSGSGMKNSFLGTEFSYEDLIGDDDYTSRYDYELAGMEDYEGIKCYHISFTARRLSETYQKQELLVDAELYVPLKASLMSRSGKLIKEIFYSAYIDYGVLFPGRVEIVNSLKKDSSSVMTVISAEFNTGIDEALFSKDELLW